MTVFILACSLITAGYSVGFGPVSWLLQSELFPTIIRGRTMALSVLVSNCTQFLSNLFFLPLIQLIGDSFTFLVYFAMCCLGGIFIYFYLIETKEQEPDEILEAYRVLIGRYSANWKSCWSFLCGKDRMNGEGAGIGIRPGVSRTQQQRGIQFMTVSNVLQDELDEGDHQDQGQREEQEEKVK
jgi:MFS family permease